MSDPYCFRARFFLTGGAHINLPGSRVVCSEPDASERVELVGHGDPPALFSVTSQLVLTGGQYATEAEALQAGERWRGFLEVGFAAASLVADFGDFAPGGGLTNAGAGMFAKLGRPVMTDEHGVMAFQCDPRPAFFAASATVTVGRSGEQVVKNIKEACRLNARFEPDKRTAYHLFSSSVAMPSPDARFLTLMTAIETLIRPEPRPEIARDFVTGLIAQAKTAELPRPQRDSILGSLEWLKAESISQAGRRLVATLGDRTYGQRTPSRFFTECYDLRSKLVHGSVPRPTFSDVNGIVGELERVTRDLLVGGVLQLGD